MYLTGRAALLAGLGGVVVIAAVWLAGGVVDGTVPGVTELAWATAGVWILIWAALVAVDVVLAASPASVLVTRELPRRARLGEIVRTEVRVANLGSRRLRGQLRDGWEPTAGAGPARGALDVPPGERRAVVIGIVPRRRGERRTAFVALRSRGPLGLAGRQAVLAAPGAIRVLPPFRSLRHLPSRIARLRELDGSTSVMVRGQGTEFDSLREYVRGDDVRSIDWRATARSQKTMLRTWRPERDRHVVIVIDSGRTSATRVGDETRLDAAMEAALLLAALADQAGDNVHLLAYDRVTRTRVTGVRGSALLPALTDALAGVDAQLIDTGWEAALAEASRFTKNPSLVVVITAADSPAAARGLLLALPPLALRTRVVVASVRDLALDQAATSRTTSEDVWLAASAERSIIDAERVAQAVVQLGADAIAAGPEDLPPRVADRYLELKRAGRL
ncbi:DUF58 domain-containing protein [uncultured Microbacterium sp.]|uniref:DUF58 domain-containing protein n=1 Tax=uncultured Microbacterium sp. TaxID=191216 RepID=UPI0025DA8338|nr:DUF58 domain-containing protein [uncultured Microbacterium sp.]